MHRVYLKEMGLRKYLGIRDGGDLSTLYRSFPMLPWPKRHKSGFLLWDCEEVEKFIVNLRKIISRELSISKENVCRK